MSLFKGWAKKKLTQEPPRKWKMLDGTWWGIVNEHGNLSEVKSSRGLADIVRNGRGDASKCKIVPLVIGFADIADIKPHLIPKPKKARKKQK